MSEAIAIDADSVEYPSSDGKPMAESPLHCRRLMEAGYAISTFVKQAAASSSSDRRGVYVGINMLVYDEPGNPRRHVSPDIFVAFDVPETDREVYKLWEDEIPAFVLEVTSRTTRKADERKKTRYAKWGVGEYFQFDPRGEYLNPALKGHQLSGAEYRLMVERPLPNGKRGLVSRELGLCLWLDDGVLRFHDPSTGLDLLTPDEERAGRQVAEASLEAAQAMAREAQAMARDAQAQAEAEAARRLETEIELAQLRARGSTT